MNTTPNAVEATGLTKHLGSFVLGPLDLHIPRGFVTGMVGANGSGKTTTLRTLLGLAHPDAGHISIPPTDRIGVAFDQPFLLPDWRVRDAASSYAAFRTGWDPAWFGGLCRRFGLRDDAKVKELSRGEGNKLSIALALGNHPDLVILDEPTSGLDPAARVDLIDLLRDHMTREDATVLFSTHITSDLENFADHLAIIDDGRIVHQGPLDEVLQEFAYIQGPREDLTTGNTPLIRGLRRSLTGFDGIIRIADTAAFGPDTRVDAPTIEQIVVHHQHRTTPEH